MRNNKISFFARISIVILAALLYLQMPVSARQMPADDELDTVVYLPLISKNYSDQPSGGGDVSGIVRDARSGVGLEGAEVCFNDTNCATTGGNGQFTLPDIAAGGKIFTADAIGHGKGSEYVVVEADKIVPLNFDLLPDLDEGEIRVVLTWDTTRTWGDNHIPNDLNLHMWTDYAEPDDHIFIDNLGNCQDLEFSPFACYENDEQYGSGPDTIVLLNNDDDFKFAVLNQNDGYPDVPLITQLSARVQVYDVNKLIADYLVPTTGTGDLWYVFELRGGAAEVRNCIVSYPIGGRPAPDCP